MPNIYSDESMTINVDKGQTFEQIKNIQKNQFGFKLLVFVRREIQEKSQLCQIRL